MPRPGTPKRTEPEPGMRMPVWIPERYYWLLAMLDRDVDKMTNQHHRRASRGSVVLNLLIKHYEPILEAEAKEHERTLAIEVKETADGKV